MINDNNYTQREFAREFVKPIIVELDNMYRYEHSLVFYESLVLDPAMGDGNILEAYADEVCTFRRPSEDCTYVRDLVKSKLNGVEIDPVACEKAIDRDILSSENVHNEDFLFFESDKKYNVVIGNPPYLGGGKISSIYGQEYFQKIKKKYDMPGRADYCAYWLIAANNIVDQDNGLISFIVTNTISQGKTRAGLARMLQMGWEIYNASTNVKWPGDANVTCSIVHLRRKVGNISYWQTI